MRQPQLHRAYQPPYCESCGAWFERKPTGRPKRFCGDACRQRAHRAKSPRWTWRASQPRLRDHLAEMGVRRIVLATEDAHGVYAKIGFAPVEPDRWMKWTAPVTQLTGKEQGAGSPLTVEA